MRQVIFIAIIIISIRSQVKAQINRPYPDLLLYMEMAAFSSNDTAEKQLMLEQKIQVALLHHDYDKAYSELKRKEALNYKSIPEEKLCWNAILLSLQKMDYQRATYYFENYRSTYDSASTQMNLLGLLVYLETDSLKSKQYFNQLLQSDATSSCLTCYNQIKNHRDKNGLFYQVSSMLIPGSGLMMIGKPIKGLTSLAVNAGMVYAVSTLMKGQLYVNAIGWGLGWGLKFYIGQIHLTEKEFRKKQERKLKTNDCASNFSKAITQYKIDYRLIN